MTVHEPVNEYNVFFWADICVTSFIIRIRTQHHSVINQSDHEILMKKMFSVMLQIG